MITDIRLKWINDRLQHGDKKRIREKANVEYHEVVDVLRGKYLGSNGELILEKAEKLIRAREKKMAAEKLKYS